MQVLHKMTYNKSRRVLCNCN